MLTLIAPTMPVNGQRRKCDATVGILNEELENGNSETLQKTCRGLAPHRHQPAGEDYSGLVMKLKGSGISTFAML